MRPSIAACAGAQEPGVGLVEIRSAIASLDDVIGDQSDK